MIFPTRQEIDTSLALEKDLLLEAADGAKIFVRSAQAAATPSRKAVILAHGVCGEPIEYVHLKSKEIFNALGYDVFLMSFYWGAPGCRHLTDTTLALQGSDLNTLIAHVKKTYDKVFVCGHSYGGLTLLTAQPQVTALAFWDPSFVPWEEFWNKDWAPLEGTPYFINPSWGLTRLVGPAMMAEAKAQTEDKSTALAATISPPSLVITAELEQRLKRKELYAALTCEKATHEIKGTDHCFWEGKVVYELVEQCHKWFEKY